MAGKGISDFKSNFKGGARNNLFKVQMSPPQGVTSSLTTLTSLEYMVKTTSLPASTVEPLNVPFRGRDLKIAGKRNFEAWSVTVINDCDFNIRKMFEEWSAAMTYHDVNTSKYSKNSGFSFGDYMVNAQIYQLIHDGNDHVEGYGYNFIGLWPSNIGAIELSSEGEAIEEFSVEFQYQYWVSNDSGIPPMPDSGNIGQIGNSTRA